MHRAIKLYDCVYIYIHIYIHTLVTLLCYKFTTHMIETHFMLKYVLTMNSKLFLL